MTHKNTRTTFEAYPEVRAHLREAARKQNLSFTEKRVVGGWDFYIGPKKIAHQCGYQAGTHYTTNL